MRSVPGEPRRDEGFTLIEMMVALTVLSLAMAGVGAFFVNGSQAVSQQRDQRQAAQVASTAIEQVRALQGSALIQGRGKAAVAGQIAYARNESPFKDKLKPYLDSMDVDAFEDSVSVAATDGANAPISTQPQQITYNGLTYQQITYVGKCDVYYMWTDKCVNPLTATKKPADATEILQYFRVVVVISYQSNRCAQNQCGYIASTLISRVSGEPQFDFKRAAPAIRDPQLPTFYVGRSDITYVLKATGGVLPNTWSATGMPAGLKVAADGTVSGTPTTAGTFTGSTVRVTESAANVGDIPRFDTRTDFLWKIVNPPAITVTPAAPKNYAGDTVSLPLAFSGGVTPYKRVQWMTGQPDTLALTSVTATGATITGKVNGTYTAMLEIEDDNGIVTQFTFTHTVLSPLTIGDVPDTKIDLGQPVNVTAAGAGGDGKYTYSATGLPTGVTINPATGAIGGVTLIPGRYLPTVTVKDTSGGTASDGFELVIATKTALNFTSPAPGQTVTSTVGQPVNIPVATNADAVNAKGTQLTAVGLPPGTKWNNGKDAIVGTPTAAGTYLVTMTATSVTPLSTAVYTFLWTIS